MGLANHHSASRVIQWCLKEGSDADKGRLTAEVRANIVPLAKSKYGRHVVQKLINVAPKEEVPGVFERAHLLLLHGYRCWSMLFVIGMSI
jgi:pumilio family protein 6